ncbi:hypothetical protein DFH08DRAFT_902638 [Mycena albidolilacea]|uniref:Uncharacterized protein n=1 Tax=Mycena albidolilacea TaxID=1033008 RepID=A0AAD7E9P1_9AGAR|nr:hypothetical protein DFH08DRAFT_902638 [Mycena albidolilacea]
MPAHLMPSTATARVRCRDERSKPLDLNGQRQRKRMRGDRWSWCGELRIRIQRKELRPRRPRPLLRKSSRRLFAHSVVSSYALAPVPTLLSTVSRVKAHGKDGRIATLQLSQSLHLSGHSASPSYAIYPPPPVQQHIWPRFPLVARVPPSHYVLSR